MLARLNSTVLELARADPRVTAGALTGSMALGSGDEWSDIDVAFGTADGIAPETVLHDWTQVLDQEFSVLDHFDLRSGSSVYRVFLLPSGLQVDVAVTPGEDFGIDGVKAYSHHIFSVKNSTNTGARASGATSCV